MALVMEHCRPCRRARRRPLGVTAPLIALSAWAASARTAISADGATRMARAAH